MKLSSYIKDLEPIIRKEPLGLTVFFSVIATVLGQAYCILRRGFDVSLIAVLKTVSLSYFMLGFPLICKLMVCRRNSQVPRAWYNNGAAYSMLALTIVLSIEIISVLPFSACLGTAIGALGMFIFVGVIFVWWLTAKDRWEIYAVVAGGIIFGIWIAGAVWGQGYLSPLFEKKILLGTAFPDTLFHISVAHMISTYGVPSTGIDMLPLLRYHFGSHWVFAQVARLVGMSPLDFYQVGFAVVFIPFSYSVFSTFVISLKDALAEHIQSDMRTMTIAIIVLLVIGQIGFLPFTSFFKCKSESYVPAIPGTAPAQTPSG